MTGLREDAFFFDGPSGHRLYGFLHEAPATQTRMGLVYVHPFAEEMNQSHAVMRRVAARLAPLGFSVLRFHLSGCGDSEGRLEDATLPAWMGEIGAARNELARRTGISRIGIIGLRAGANLAAMYSKGREDIACIALLAPVTSLATYMQQFLRHRVAARMAGGGGPSTSDLVKEILEGRIVEVIGYPIARALYEGFAASTEQPSGKFRCAVAFFSIGEAVGPPDALSRWAGQTQGAGQPAMFRHIRTVPFWDRYWEWDAPSLGSAIAEWHGSIS